MSMTLSGSEHSTTRRSPYASFRSILRVRSAGNGHCKPRKSRSMEKTPNSMFAGDFDFAQMKLRDAGLDFQQTLVEF
jgi:hypothetical protein